MKIKIILLVVLLLQVFSLLSWSKCTKANDSFVYAAQKVDVALIGDIHNDIHVPLTLVRIFHNKPEAIITAYFNTHIRFFDSNFLIALLSIAGVFGYLCGIWYAVTKKHAFLKTFVLVSLGSPLFEILLFPNGPFFVKRVLFALPFMIVSLLGMHLFLTEHKKSNKAFFFVGLLLLLSLGWLLTVHLQVVYNFCT